MQAARADTYPSRVIKLVVPFTPGSPNDVMARLLTQHLQTRLGQAIVVDNKPGGGTLIGTRAAATAEPDGYTLLFISSALVVDPAMKGTAYDPFKEFAPVASVNTTFWLITVSPSLPVKTMAEFVAYTKAHPGTVNFAATQGTAAMLVAERFKQLSTADLLIVPYKGGAAALPDFLGGRIQVLNPTPSTSSQLIHEGKMRALMITSPERIAAYLKERGGGSVTLHIIDDAQLGAGRVWETAQTRTLCMNTLAGAVTLFTEPGATVAAPVLEGPTMYEWIQLVRGEREAVSGPKRSLFDVAVHTR